MSIRGRYGSSLELDPEEPAPLESVFRNSTLEKFSMLARPASASTANPEFCCTVSGVKRSAMNPAINAIYYTEQSNRKRHLSTGNRSPNFSTFISTSYFQASINKIFRQTDKGKSM